MVGKSIRTATGQRGNSSQTEQVTFSVSFSRRVVLLIFSILMIIASGCADIGSPPGGPIDRTGPFILTSEPADGSLNVPPGDRITLYFSETIIRPEAGNAIFLSPRQSGDLNLVWKSDKLTIIFPDSFRAEQTYVISVNNNVTDLRRNPMDSNATIAFSTGDILDTGRVSGQVFDNSKPAPGVQVALYDLSKLVDDVVYDSLLPDYIVAGNREGLFSFRNLPTREFRIVAYVDKNRDDHLSPYTESHAVGDRDIIIEGDNSLDNLQLPLTKLDTSVVRILSARQTVDGLLIVQLNRAIPLSQLASNTSGIRLFNLDSLSKQPTLRAISFVERHKKLMGQLNIYFGNMNAGTYSLSLDWNVKEEPLLFDTIKIESSIDNRPPALTVFNPEKSPAFSKDTYLSLRFSEPIDTAVVTDKTFSLWTDDSNLVNLNPSWEDPFTLLLNPDNLKEGESYRIDLTEFEIADMAGNLFGDSLTQFEFSIYDSDSLGKVSGEIIVSLLHRKVDPVVLSFAKTDNQRVFLLPVAGRLFSLDLPPGKYLLSGFIDSDFDGEYGKGRLIPFSFSETFAQFPDTISVRARFETSGIEMDFK